MTIDIHAILIRSKAFVLALQHLSFLIGASSWSDACWLSVDNTKPVSYTAGLHSELRFT